MFYAAWSERVGAWLLDVLIAGGALFVGGVLVAVVVALVVSPSDAGGVGEVVGALIAVAFVPLFPAYLAVFHGGVRGQTPGKRVIGIAVRPASTRLRISYARAFARSYLTMVMWLLYMIPAIVDGLWPLWDSRRQALHDKVARTIVVRVVLADPATQPSDGVGGRPPRTSAQLPGKVIAISAGVVLAIAVSLVVVLRGSGGRAVGLPYAERFSGSCSRWSTQDDHLLRAGCGNGEYRVLARDARNVQFFTVPVQADSVKVEVDARVAAGAPPQKYGIGCFRADHSGTWFAIAPGKGYQIVWYDEYGVNGAAHARVATEQTQAILPRATYRIGALCTSGRPGGSGSSGITAMWVDGKFVLNSVDPSAITAGAIGDAGKIEHVGVIVFPSTTGSDIRFDNFTVHYAPETIGLPGKSE